MARTINLQNRQKATQSIMPEVHYTRFLVAFP